MIFTLQGYSDDIVYIGPQGTPHSDEVYAYSDDGRFVELSTGQVFHVVYSDEGVWRVTQVAGETDGVSYQPAEAAEDDDVYSDVATITCPDGTTWCAWETWPPRRHEAEDFLRDNVERYFEKLSDEEIFAARRRLQA